MANAWDRREGESSPAYEAFNAYCLMGVKRNTRAVGHGLGKSRAIIDRWSSKHDWVERSAAWDRHQSAIEHRAITRVKRTAAEKWARRDDQFREGLWRPMALTLRHGAALIARAREAEKPVPADAVRALTAMTRDAAILAEKALNGVARGSAEATLQLTIPDVDDRTEEPGQIK